MDAYELVEKFKSNPKSRESYQEIIKWCGENVHDFDITNKEQQYLYEMATRYLMKQKIGNLNQSDAKVLINYLAKKYARTYGIENRVTVKILEEQEYRDRFKDNSNATCVSIGNGESEVIYSPRVINNLMSNETLKFIRGLQTIFHEVIHSRQYNDIYGLNNKETQYTGHSYKIALETIMRKVSPEFYKENYLSLIMEYEAEYLGLEEAMKTLDEYYKPNMLQGQNIEEILIEMLKCDGKVSYEDMGKVNFAQSNVNAATLINFAADNYIARRPDIINQIPVLRFAYNSDGTKKNILQLVQDRENLISNNGGNNTQSIDDLYTTIANYRRLDKDEIRLLDGYIEETGADDEFIFNLIRYRLEHQTKMTQEQIDEYMELECRTAANSRESHQGEIMWETRFQSWEKEAGKLPDGIKKKEETVSTIKEMEKQEKTGEKAEIEEEKQ